ncbi:unnamed protein product [Hyaloperonospora brassicae]|uniref:RxLR effector candidate protein n=1 Tax=Hyaloperonospora brassicae TaxID=162125 RepID=A0AAV0V465_HYABA|nr:unnamed protein product [Hyaloperonospora brassicae]
MFSVIAKLMDALFPNWRAKLIGVSSDGEYDDRAPPRPRHEAGVSPRVQCPALLVRSPPDRHPCQAECRQNRRRGVDKVCLFLHRLPARSEKFNHRNGRQVPQKDEPLGASRISA